MTKEALEEDIRYWKSRFEELQKLYDMKLSQLDDWKLTCTRLEKDNESLMDQIYCHVHGKDKQNGRTIQEWQDRALESETINRALNIECRVLRECLVLMARK